MNRLPVLTLAVGLAVALVPGFASAATKCADPHGFIEQRACAMAAAGPDALRRFIHRTRGIYNLYYADFAPRER